MLIKPTNFQERQIREILSREGFETLNISFEDKELIIKAEPIYWKKIIEIVTEKVKTTLEETKEMDIQINL